MDHDTSRSVRFDRVGLIVVDIEPDRSIDGAVGVVIRKNKVGSCGPTNRYVSWFVAASAGARGAPVRNLTTDDPVRFGAERLLQARRRRGQLLAVPRVGPVTR